MTERRCPVRNLLADAGVNVDMMWDPVSPGPATSGAPSRPAG